MSLAQLSAEGKRKSKLFLPANTAPFPTSQPYVCLQRFNFKGTCTQTHKRTARSPLSRSGVCLLCHSQGKVVKKKLLLLQPHSFMNTHQQKLRYFRAGSVCVRNTCDWETLLLPSFGKKAAAILGRSVRLRQVGMGTERFLRA